MSLGACECLRVKERREVCVPWIYVSGSRARTRVNTLGGVPGSLLIYGVLCLRRLRVYRPQVRAFEPLPECSRADDAGVRNRDVRPEV